MSAKTYEMLWDCQFCGTKKLLGKTHRFCPNCGAPQNPDARYFPSDEEKVAVEDHVFVGRDKICPSCNELNAGNAEFCQQCGAPMSEAQQANLVGQQVRGVNETFEAMASRDVTKEKYDAEMQRVGVKPKNDQKSNMKWIIGILALVVVVIGGIIFLLNWTEEASVYVAGHNWERNIVVEEYQNVTVQSWRDSRPAGYNMSIAFGSCTERQRGSRQVPDGQDCRTVRVDNGDGTFSQRQECTTRYRSEPIYADWCTWRGQNWVFDYDAPSSGDSLSDTPYWEDVSLNCADTRNVGCERIARQEQTYNVVFQGDGTQYVCAYDQDVWDDFAIESYWVLDVRVVDNNAADCASARPAN
jgi:ribosomal protein L40E